MASINFVLRTHNKYIHTQADVMVKALQYSPTPNHIRAD